MENVLGIVCGGLFILIFFAAGVAAVVFGIRNRKKAEESAGWPGVQGVITNAWIEESRDTDEDGYTSTTYTPKWQYEYQLGSQTYSSQKISFGGERGYGSRKKAEQELTKYSMSGQVRVYYNPQDPEEAVLVQGTKGTMAGIIVGVILILVSACTACIGGYVVISNM